MTDIAERCVMGGGAGADVEGEGVSEGGAAAVTQEAK